MTLTTTTRILIHPSHTARQKLWTASHACKDVWNFLNEQKRSNPRPNYFALKKRIPILKTARPDLTIPGSQTLQETVKSLTASYKMFSTKKKNGSTTVQPPKFKSFKHFFTQKYPQNGVSFIIADYNEEKGTANLRLAYGKRRSDWIEIELRSSRNRKYALPSPTSVRTVTISYDKVSHNWYASLSFDLPVPISMDHASCPHIMYFDPGCVTTLTGIKTDVLATHTIYEYDINPLRELTMKHYQLLDQLKSRRDKKVKGSREWRRLNAKIKKIYGKMNTQSKHYLHVLSNQILEDNPDVHAFMVGDWDKQETLADTGYTFIDKRINRQVQNNNPVRKLIEYLNYKAVRLGRKVEKFDERGTTRTCSWCGHVIEGGVKPGVRVFRCEECGFTIERDINSVLNFLKIHQYALWQGLRGMVALSSVRQTVHPVSGKNRRALERACVLKYQDARGL